MQDDSIVTYKVSNKDRLENIPFGRILILFFDKYL